MKPDGTALCWEFPTTTGHVPDGGTGGHRHRAGADAEDGLAAGRGAGQEQGGRNQPTVAPDQDWSTRLATLSDKLMQYRLLLCESKKP